MKPIRLLAHAMLAAAWLFGVTSVHAAGSAAPAALRQAVDQAVGPLISEHAIAGMAVAVTVRGKPYFFNYGVASRQTGSQVTEHTIFEIGSISKTFTTTLASYAQARGALSLSDHASQHLPALAGSAFDAIRLLDLGTYTAGGLPQQFPDGVDGPSDMIDYYRRWQPAYPPGTHRVYSNPSLGLFGYLAAQSLGKPFDVLMEDMLFPLLGLTRTYIKVPPNQMDHYAQGEKDGKPIRVAPGLMDAQAYGVKTTAADLLRFIALHLDGPGRAPARDPLLHRAIAGTLTGYFRIGDMTQGLGWEMYAYPTRLDSLLAGNSRQMIFQANPVTWLAPPQPPRAAGLVNKTGSTNGFGAYVAFVPARHIGVVMLANKNYPIADRVKAAYRILTALATMPSDKAMRDEKLQAR